MSFADPNGLGQAAYPVTLENVLAQSANVLDQVDSLVRAAARIETMLTGRQLAMKERNAPPKPAGMVYCLNVNLLDVVERVGELCVVLSIIEDTLAEPKAENAAQVPFPTPPPIWKAGFNKFENGALR